MKIHTAWSDTLAQNAALKWSVLALSSGLVVLTAVAARLAVRDPLVIERGCTSEVAETQPGQTSESELKAFLGEAVPSRFNTGAPLRSSFMSTGQLKARLAEQAELGRRGMRQVVVINGVLVKDKRILVDSDRLIAVGKVRSAFAFPLEVEVQVATRTRENPYGLLLTKIAPASETNGAKQ